MQDLTFRPSRGSAIQASHAIAAGHRRSANNSELIECWRTLRRRKAILFAAAALGLAVAMAVTLPQTPLYQSRASLEVQDINQEFMNLKELSPIADSTAINALNDLQTQIKILQSEALKDRTIAKLRSMALTCPGTEDGAPPLWFSLFHGPKAAMTKVRYQDLVSAAKTLKVRAAGQTRIIEILVDSTDPRISCAFVNILATEFVQQNIESRWTMTQQTSDWLVRELEGMRLKLEGSEGALQRYARQNGLLYTDGKENVSEEKLHQLQADLIKAQTDRLAKQSRYAVARSAPADAVPDVVTDVGLRDLQFKLTDLRRQQAELDATFKPDYPKSKKIRAQIAEVEAARDQQRKAILDRIANEYEEARQNEKLLAAVYSAQSHLVTQNSEKAIQYGILKREVDANRQIYEAMLQRVKESNIASAMKPSNIRIIDHAKLPRVPYKPKLPLNVAMGFLAGGLAAIAGVMIQGHADRRLQVPGDASLLLNLPELGVIPTTEPPRVAPRAKTAPKLLISEKKNSANEFASFTLSSDQSSLVADSFKGVLASILFAGETGKRPQVLVIASAGQGEGKTTSCANLAHAVAQVESKVLIIDADLRRPRVHDIFGAKNEAGLADLLRQRSLNEELASTLVRKTEIPNLHVLTSGQSNAAAKLFFSSSMPSLIAWCRKHYEMVIIDTPPMLLTPDARMLGPISDAVVLVVRAGQTTRDAALAARQRFAEDRTPILGVILNDWDPRASSGRYYGYLDVRKLGAGSEVREIHG
jgi:polysaccharide biosynthesis transport protein